MRIGVDLCELDPDYVGGVSTFVTGLVKGLLETREADETVVLIVSSRNASAVRQKFSGFGAEYLEVRLTRVRARINTTLFDISWALGNFKLRYWYDRVFRSRLMRHIDSNVDVVLAPTTLLSFYGLRAPSLLSIHDIQQEYHPEFFSWKQRLRRWAPYRLSTWRSAVVQASSEYIKQCLLEKFSFMNSAKINVIPEGVDISAFSETEDRMPVALGDKELGSFIFYPAQLWPHKNHLFLIDSLAEYRDRMGSELTCLLTGGDYGCWPEISARIQHHGLGRVHYLGRVTFPELLWIYRNCDAVLALGLHESSSLPVREGAVFGKVLICLDIPPNCEVARNLKVELVNRASSSDLVRALVALGRNRPGARDAALENAELSRIFDWKVIAWEYRRAMRSMIQC